MAVVVPSRFKSNPNSNLKLDLMAALRALSWDLSEFLCLASGRYLSVSE